MATQVRNCSRCGAVIEIELKDGMYVVNANVNKNRTTERVRSVMFNALCGECRKWIAENTSR